MSTPDTQTINASEARQNFSQLLNRVFRRETRLVVERSGIPIAAIISAGDLEALQRAEEQRQRDFAILDEIGTAFKGVPGAEVEQEAAEALAAARKSVRTSRGS